MQEAKEVKVAAPGWERPLVYTLYTEDGLQPKPGYSHSLIIEVTTASGDLVATIGLWFEDGELIDYDGVDELFSWDAKAIRGTTGMAVPDNMYTKEREEL